MFETNAPVQNRAKSRWRNGANDVNRADRMGPPTVLAAALSQGRVTVRRVSRACRSLFALVAALCLVAACGSADEDDAAASPSRTSTPGTAALPTGDRTTVQRVVDGDTIVVDGDERVRFIGMDTPETKDPRKPVQCFGKEAARRTEQLLPPGTPIVLVYDVDRFDRYGRTLAYVYRARDGMFVNASLVRDGYAQVDTVPPDVAHADDFVALQRAARNAGRGLWTKCR